MGSMWRDESVTYQVAHRSSSEIVDLLHHADAVHGLYYLLMHALFGVWDGGLITLRLPSVLATAVTAGVVGIIALRLTARPAAGLMSGLAFAITPQVQMYAQEGRSYALVCAFVALATWLLVTLTRDPSPWRWCCYGSAVLVAALLHEFAVFALLAHGITLYRSPAARAGSRRRFTATAAGVGVALLPLVVLSVGQSAQVSWIGSPKAAEWFEIAGVAVLASACAGYLYGPGRAADVSRLALPLALLPTGVLLLIGAVHEDIYVDRYVLYTSIGVALLAGTTAVRLADRVRRPTPRGRAARTVVAGLAVLASAAATLPAALQMRTPAGRKDNVTAIAREVARQAEHGDTVLFTPSRRREWMLSHPGEFSGLADIALKDTPRASGTLQGTEWSAPDIGRRLARAERVVVLSDPAGQPLDTGPGEAIKRSILERDFTACRRTELRGGRVTLYTRAFCPPHTHRR